MINNNSLWFESYKINFDFSKTFHNLSIFKDFQRPGKTFSDFKDFQGPYEPCMMSSFDKQVQTDVTVPDYFKVFEVS